MSDEAVWTQIETLYRSRFAAFERVARSITGDRETAREAVQDGFADALRHAKQWDGRGSLEAWVWRVCRQSRPQGSRPAAADRARHSGVCL